MLRLLVVAALSFPDIPGPWAPGPCGGSGSESHGTNDSDGSLQVGLVGPDCKQFSGVELQYLQLMEMALTGSLMDEVGSSQSNRYSFKTRANGQDWPVAGHTMVGHMRLRNVREALLRVVQDEVPGDFVELGVWRGGTCIYARAVLNLIGLQKVRKVILFDVFGKMIQYGPHQQILAVSNESVLHNFDKYGLLPSDGKRNPEAHGIQLREGLFEDTAIQFRRANIDESGNLKRSIAVLRIDGNFYKSHEDALYALWDFVPIKGIIIFDDGYHPHVHKFVRDFREDQDLDFKLKRIDKNGGAWFRKETDKKLNMTKKHNPFKR